MLFLPIRDMRTKLGFSQTRLAHLSGISLPFIQQIESGRANPSVETLSALGGALGFEVRLLPLPADWDELARHGAPLLAKETLVKSPRATRPNGDSLIRALTTACLELESSGDVPDRGRKLAATQALCWAIQTEFPKFFKKHLNRSPLFVRFIPEMPSGELIKLRRIAASTLATFI